MPGRVALEPLPPSVTGNANAALSLRERQKQAIDALSTLADLAGNICLVIAQPELDCPELHELGFAAVRFGAFTQQGRDLAATLAEVHGVLVVNSGNDIEAAKECCGVLDRLTDPPLVVSVVLAPGNEPEDGSGDAQAEMACAAALLDAGAMDVVTIYGSNPAFVSRLRVAFLRSEIATERVRNIVAAEIASLRRTALKKTEASWRRRLLQELPGSVLENIPFEDPSLVEHIGPVQGAEGLGARVGDYRVTRQLSAAPTHAILKAEHLLRGTFAMKIVQKTTVKSMLRLLCIDAELSIIFNLPPHQNVAHAREVLHGRKTITIVMDFCGDQTLQHFVNMKLTRDGAGAEFAAFPADVVESFCSQETAAVLHLHSHMVCHRDLKPANFIVSRDGKQLRLADFSVAAMACGPSQRFLHCCGSLPFVAPEVLRLQNQRDGGPPRCGYDGFAADVWSLAVNFMDLGCGLYGVERGFGWLPAPPTDAERRLQDLECLADTAWRRANRVTVPSLERVLGLMLVLDVAGRCGISRVAGRHGFGLLPEDCLCPSVGCPHNHGPRRQLTADDFPDWQRLAEGEEDITYRVVPEEFEGESPRDTFL